MNKDKTYYRVFSMVFDNYDKAAEYCTATAVSLDAIQTDSLETLEECKEISRAVLPHFHELKVKLGELQDKQHEVYLQTKDKWEQAVKQADLTADIDQWEMTYQLGAERGIQDAIRLVLNQIAMYREIAHTKEA